MRQIRFDTRAALAFFFCSFATSSHPILPLIVAFLFFFLLSLHLFPRRPCLSVTSSFAARVKGTRGTSYANADNNRTSIREKVNFRGYSCFVLFFLLFFVFLFLFFFPALSVFYFLERKAVRISTLVYIN